MGTCAKCSLCFSAKQAVPPIWLGDLYDIKAMFIGEGPGADEDKYGKPFIGRSGQLFQDLLQEVYLTDKVYVTNVVKHRPPKNRTPTEDERNICSELFLSDEISYVDPEIIVCLGRTAAESLMRWSRRPVTGSLRGNYFDMGGPGTPFEKTYRVICTWHPAYVLRRMDKRDELKADLESARDWILF